MRRVKTNDFLTKEYQNEIESDLIKGMSKEGSIAMTTGMSSVSASAFYYFSGGGFFALRNVMLLGRDKDMLLFNSFSFLFPNQHVNCRVFAKVLKHVNSLN